MRNCLKGNPGKPNETDYFRLINAFPTYSWITFNLWMSDFNHQSLQSDYAPMAGEIVRELRRYVSKHGHFTLVEVISSEGDHIKITV